MRGLDVDLMRYAIGDRRMNEESARYLIAEYVDHAKETWRRLGAHPPVAFRVEGCPRHARYATSLSPPEGLAPAEALAHVARTLRQIAATPGTEGILFVGETWTGDDEEPETKGQGDAVGPTYMLSVAHAFRLADGSLMEGTYAIEILHEQDGRTRLGAEAWIRNLILDPMYGVLQ